MGRCRQYSLLGQSLSGLSALLWLGACAGGAVDDSAGAGGPDVDRDGDDYPASVDYDDLNSEIHPDADEFCDGLNNDCSPATVPCEFTDTVSEIQSPGSLNGIIVIWSCSPTADRRRV